MGMLYEYSEADQELIKGGKERMFKVGQKVKVIGTGGCHSTYKNFFGENGLTRFFDKYRDGNCIKKGIHTVVATGLYEGKQDSYYKKLYLLEDSNGQVFIMSNVDGKFIEAIEPLTLSTGDMINALMANPEQRYKNERYGGIAGLDESGKLKLFYGGEYKPFEVVMQIGEVPTINGKPANGNIYDQWILIPPEPKPVPFMEAVKAYAEGRTVECEYNGDTTTYESDKPNDTFCKLESLEILRGTWYISHD
jgi:hypothetical protein